MQEMDNFRNIVKDKSDKELLKMVYEFQEWSPEMLTAIEQELSSRNILPTDIKTRKQEAAEIEEAELEKGKQASLTGQIVGWLTVLGLVGFFIGYNYAFSKVKSKYTGKQFFKYNETSRNSGTYMFYTSLVLVIIEIGYRLLNKY